MKTPLIALAVALLAVLGGCCVGPNHPVAPPGVVRHVVLFKFKDDAPPDKVREIEAKFRALENQIPAIMSLEWGTDMSPEKLAQGFTHCFLLTFKDAAARDSYLPHPAHKEFGAALRPYLDKVLVIDYVSRD